eukprot:11895729-Alexandrium_andersonii.AAC.1
MPNLLTAGVCHGAPRAAGRWPWTSLSNLRQARALNRSAHESHQASRICLGRPIAAGRALMLHVKKRGPTASAIPVTAPPAAGATGGRPASLGNT